MSKVRELATFVTHALRHASPMPNRMRAIARFAARQAHKRIVGKPLIVSWEGLQLEVPPNAHSAAAAFYFGRQDWWELAFIERLLRPGDRVADVGANVGVYTMFLAKCVGSAGEVVSCEPDPANVAQLERQLERNALKQVRVVRSAVGASVGSVRFSAGHDTVGHIDRTGEAGSTEVPITTMDALFPSDGPIFVKVDVEGFESDVLRGARAVMSRGFPLAWQLELQDAGEGHLVSDVARLLKENGYAFFYWDPDEERLVAADWRHPEGGNLLAIRDLDAVLARLSR